jgi:peptidoglycan/LPS O-acetylase OafA/YrhL
MAPGVFPRPERITLIEQYFHNMALQYRADIDGLRAIAVILVIFFHTNIPYFSGGFVGVDVFFVISGFLITSIILKDIENGRFSVVRFYERRIKRIFPALFTVIFATLLAGSIIFDANAFKDLGQSTMATTLFASNILFLYRSNYFDLSSLQKPLLHTWSLAVEEQFYMFFPLILVAVSKFFNKRFIFWLVVIWLLSFAGSVWEIDHDRMATFYQLPTRAWELLSGALLAVNAVPAAKSNFRKNLLSLSGIALILYSSIFYSEKTIFPAYNAILPVLGSCLLIHSGKNGVTGFSSLLSRRSVVYVGHASYSLYLWHWPLIAYTRYVLYRDPTLPESIVLIIVTFIISALSLKYVEQPFRGGKSYIATRHLFAFSAVIMLLTTSAGLIIHLQRGMPYRNPKTNAESLNVNNDPQWIDFEINAKKLDAGEEPRQLGAAGTEPSFVLWGDSHANALAAGLSETAKRYGKSGYSIVRPTNLPMIGVEPNPSGGEAAKNRQTLEFIKRHPNVRTVVIAGYWSMPQHLRDIDGEYRHETNYAKLLKVGLERTVDSLLVHDRRVVIVSDVPVLKHDPYHLLWVSNAFGKTPDFGNILPTSSEYQNSNREFLAIADDLSKRKKVIFLHPEEMLFDKYGKSFAMAGNKLLYVDNDHLSSLGSRFIGSVFDQVVSPR